jgi:hypothetical protein
MNPPPPSRITAWKMRWFFRKHNIWQKVKRGELTAVLVSDHKCIREANQLPGAKSQMLEYRDSNNQTVAKVHQYTNPDGSIGAFGKPDPKSLMINGVLYHQPSSRNKVSVFQQVEDVILRNLLYVLYRIDDHIGYIRFVR